MKNKYFNGLVLASAFLGLTYHAQAQNKAEVEKIRSKYDLVTLQKIENRLLTKENLQKKEALALAAKNGWDVQKTNADGSFMELQRVVDGKPVYYTTFNVDAARSTRTNHLNNGGSLGLNLMGQGMTAYVWDGGATRTTHQEFDGAGGNNRVIINDGVTTLNGNSFHAQHVTGTIVASGVQANAKGMAPHAKARTSDWTNDESEATSAAANGMIISNHSYGIAAINPRTGASNVPDYYFGGYIQDSRNWDEIMFNAPAYLMVVAAGNDGNFNNANGTPNQGFGWDKLTGHSTSKNNLVVANAQDANVDANGNLVSVSINSGSSEGPTDDLRIKPDITGNGTGVYSTYDNSDTAYNSISGTSMASPNVTGSLLLLQQHYKNLNNGDFMQAATLKGLALHTADDAGASGPDAVFGWGLLNAKRAAEVITNKGTQTKIEELTLNSGQTYTITVDSDGTSPLLASISWTDRPGTAVTSASTAKVLVNDLDIRVSKNGTEFFPYELTGPTTSAKRDNDRDPYERVDVANASGTYTITVTNKGNLVGGSQAFSLIVSGITDTPPPPAECATLPYSESFESNDGWTQVGGDDGNWVRNSGTTPSNTTGPSAAAQGSYYMFLEASTNSSPGQIGNNATAILESGCFDLSGKSSASFTFKSHMYGSNMGSLKVQVSNNDGSSWTDVFTKSGDQGNQWNNESVSLNTYVGSTIKLRIVGTTGSGWRSDVAVDDLAVTAETAGSDTQAPSTPSNVQASNIAQTTASLSWTASTDNVGVTGYDVYQGATKIGTVTGNSASLSDLTPATNYTFSIRAKDAAGNESGAGSVTFTTLSTQLTYCASTGSRTQFEWIDKVSIGGINNVTAAGDGYSDFTSQVGTLARGTTNSITLSAGFSGTAYTEFWGVWIDFNQNGTFEDSERVTSGSSSSSGDIVDETVIVPANAVLGHTRMRVSMKYNANQTACESFGDGEVEDYTINIVATATNSITSDLNSNAEVLGNEKPVKVMAYPNPATDFVQVNLASKGSNATYKIVNTIGRVVKAGNLNNRNIDISQLNAGMYILEVNDSQKLFTTKLIKK